MKITLLAALVTLTIAGAAQAQSHPAWIVGKWNDTSQETPCGNYSSSYDAGGRYEGGGDTAGTWIFSKGRVCTRQLIEYDYDHSRWRITIGKPVCTPIKRKGPKIEAQYDSGSYAWTRCGPPKITPGTIRIIEAAKHRHPR